MFKTNKNKNMSNSMQDKFDLISSSTFKREHSTVWVTNDYDQFSFIEKIDLQVPLMYLTYKNLLL